MAFGGFGWRRGGSSPVMKPVKYLFVDGAYFLKIAQNVARAVDPSLDYLSTINFSVISHPYDRSFYYDSYPPENAVDYESKRSQKEILFETINLTPNFRVNYGASKNWNKRRGVEQKGVDVLLAIEVFQHAVSGNMDIASIVTGDVDFLPLLEAISRTRVKTEILFDPKKHIHGVNTRC